MQKTNLEVGQLSVKIHKAYLIRNTSWFKMNPYVIVRFGNNKIQTKNKFKSSHKTPEWNENITTKLKGDERFIKI